MMLKYFGVSLSVILLCILNSSQAQTYSESALQFSRTTPGGSARIQGLGGAQIALGGDYSSSLSNPAGLGFYNKSEFTFSPAVTSLTTNTRYLGNSETDLKTKLIIPGFSVVINMPKSKDGFMGGSIGISMTRVNDFNQSFIYKGTSSNSIIDSFLESATGDDPSQFDGYAYNTPTRLAYDNFLIGEATIINPSASNKEYFTDLDEGNLAYQFENVQTKGATNQWNISYGGNYKDKLFLGAGLGIASLKYSYSKNYSESFNNDDIRNLDLQENLNIRGSGLNLTLGAIGKPVDFIQVGASYSTPTFYQLTESYDASMTSSWTPNFDYFKNGKTLLNNESAQTDIVKTDYTLVLPSKLNLGLALISKLGFLTGDVELMNAAGSRYSTSTSASDFASSDYNKQIKSNYKMAINYRVGAEFRYSFFRARAGYGVQTNTFSTSYRNEFKGVDPNNKISSVSGGVGVRGKKAFADFALVFSNSNGLYSPYGSQLVEISNKLVKGMVTVGFTF